MRRVLAVFKRLMGQKARDRERPGIPRDEKDYIMHAIERRERLVAEMEQQADLYRRPSGRGGEST